MSYRNRPVATILLCVALTLSLAQAQAQDGGAPAYRLYRFAAADIAALQTYDDRWAKGDSSITLAPAGGGVMQISARLGKRFAYPFAGVSMPFQAGGTPVDMRQYKGVRLQVRGEAVFKVQLLSANVTDNNEFASEVVSEKEWKTISLPFPSFAQSPYWGRAVAWDASALRGVNLHFDGMPGAPALQIEMRELSMYR
ncbi:CIA30 family protein [Massilia sp. DWR3-1-1]|uniref:CIA30 family protein n=1 Tax=Massilia sp. DWR3-1-1 TaxID=2804559 RepID=UPI003CEDA702